MAVTGFPAATGRAPQARVQDGSYRQVRPIIRHNGRNDTDYYILPHKTTPRISIDQTKI